MPDQFIGLKSENAKELLNKYGYNEFGHREKNLALELLIRQFKNPLLILMLIVISISYLLGETIDIILLTIVAFLNTSVGFIQEYSSSKTLKKLQNFIRTKSLVIRDDKKIKIENRFIVPGDIVILSKGDKIPADGILQKSNNFIISEAFLTGESTPIVKKLHEDIFAGSYVVSGTAIIEIKKTGESTKYGEIATDLSNINQGTTHIQRLLEDFSKKLIILSIVLISIILLISLIQGSNFLEAIRVAITLAVTIIPESLVLIITIALTVGAKRILKGKGLVKKLTSVENLGLTTIMCIDKTGTLTEGKMKVISQEIISPKYFYLAITLLNEQKTPIENALFEFGNQKNDEKVAKYVVNEYIEFDSKNKYTAGLFRNIKDENSLLLIMGTPEKIISRCNLDEKEIVKIQAEIKRIANLGEKLIAVGYKEGATKLTDNNLKWAGFVGIEDNLRVNVKDLLENFKKYGIGIKMLTGDNRQTSLKIAQKAGLTLTSEDVADGNDYKNFDQDTIYKHTIFANITPQQKLQIVKTLKSMGETITMTGDGINDILALKKADVAVSMGEASDIAQEEADLILLDDNLETLGNSVKEGRLVIRNIKNIVAYTLSNSFAEIIIIFLASTFGLPFPFLISQILWLHMICDGPLDFALAFEKNYSGLMGRDTHSDLIDGIVNRKTLMIISLISSFIGLLSFGVFYIYAEVYDDIVLARTLVFIISASSSVFYIFSFKDLSNPIYRIKNIGQNKILNISVVFAAILAFSPIFIPILKNIFEIADLQVFHVFLIIFIEILIIIWVEAVKFVLNRPKDFNLNINQIL